MRGEQTTKARMKALLTELKIYPGRGHSEILFSALAEERAQIVADIRRLDTVGERCLAA